MVDSRDKQDSPLQMMLKQGPDTVRGGEKPRGASRGGGLGEGAAFELVKM